MSVKEKNHNKELKAILQFFRARTIKLKKIIVKQYKEILLDESIEKTFNKLQILNINQYYVFRSLAEHSALLNLCRKDGIDSAFNNHSKEWLLNLFAQKSRIKIDNEIYNEPDESPMKQEEVANFLSSMKESMKEFVSNIIIEGIDECDITDPSLNKYLDSQGKEILPSETTNLLNSARNGKLIIFIGAGASMVPPTKLPSWIDFHIAVLNAISKRIDFLPNSTLKNYVQYATNMLKNNKLPPEYHAEIIAGCLGNKYFDVLTCLDGGALNIVHHSLATLVRLGAVAAIITTNFDRNIERAFDKANPPIKYKVRSEKKGFSNLEKNETFFNNTSNHCEIIKIHGSADDPNTLIDTLAQRSCGFPNALIKIIRNLLKSCHWLFIGYSGRDLAAVPNYLSLRSMSKAAKGFTWLVREGDQPHEAVEELVSIYNGKGKILFGDLITWMSKLIIQLGGTPVESDKVKLSPPVNIANITNTWAMHLKELESVRVLAYLLKAAGKKRLAKNLLEKFKSKIKKSSPQDLVVILKDIAGLYKEIGQDEEAISLYNRAYEIYESLGDNLNCFRLKSELEMIYEKEGKYNLAISTYEYALQIAAAFGDNEYVSRLFFRIGRVYRSLGRYDLSISNFQRSLDIDQRLGDEANKGITMQQMGITFMESGKYDMAQDLFFSASEIFKHIGNDDCLAYNILYQSTIDRFRGDIQEALKKAKKALHYFQQDLGNLNGALEAQIEIAQNLADLNDHKGALKEYKRCLSYTKKSGNKKDTGTILNNMGKSYRQLGDYEKAEHVYKRALDIRRKIGNLSHVAATLNNIAILHQKRRQIKMAIEVYEESMELYMDIGDILNAALVRFNIGTLELNYNGALDKAKEHFTYAYEVFEEFGSGYTERALIALTMCKAIKSVNGKLI